MKMHCRRCQHTYENALECPDCGARLHHYSERAPDAADLSEFAGSDAHRWDQPLQRAGAAPRSSRWRSLALVLVGTCVAAALAGVGTAFHWHW